MASRAVEYPDMWRVIYDSEHLRHGHPLPVRVVLRYLVDDPFTVALEFDEDNVWHFARELLLLGLNTHAGLGDVRIWPQDDAVFVTLSSPDGCATMAASRVGVRRFLMQTTRLVPIGQEVWHQVIPDDVAELLEGSEDG